jgi:hypothetical protein
VEVLDLDGRIILKKVFKKWDWGMDWIDLAQDRDSWRSIESGVINLRNVFPRWEPVRFYRRSLLNEVSTSQKSLLHHATLSILLLLSPS